MRSRGSPLLALVCLATALDLSRAEPPARIALGGRPGFYAVKQWKRDWPGCEFEDGVKHGRVSLTEHDGGRWLRVAYQVGQIGPEKNGAGWRYPFGQHDAAELSYSMRFSPDFEWVKGGKLPGLAGGPENVAGGHPATGANGFSARLMWRAGGRGEAYVYHVHQPTKYGESFPFPEDFRFPTDAPMQVRLRVTMNAPGKRDGTLRVWIAERLMVERTDMEWRTTDRFGVDSLYFETFYGGGERDWALTRAGWTEFGAFEVRPE